jgi:ABC-2 type transport system ATP-binding protein
MRLELRNVHKQFGAQVVLRDVSVVIDHGTRVALVGPNGSGKSTLLRAIMGLIHCDGEVLLDGRSPFRHRSETAQHLAYVPQTAPALGAPVADVVKAICALRGLAADAVSQWADRMELDLRAASHKPFRALSGGMKQKLLIALAFASHASLYILDEPTASLDGAARARFIELLAEATNGATLLVCSHRLDEVSALVGRVIELGDGRIVRQLDAMDGRSASLRDQGHGR